MDRMVKNRPNILIFFTILAVGVSFAWLGVQDPSQWPAGVVLYMLGCKCCPFFLTISCISVPVISCQVVTISAYLSIYLLIR